MLTLLRNVISLQQIHQDLPSDGLRWLGIQIPIRRSSKELQTVRQENEILAKESKRGSELGCSASSSSDQTFGLKCKRGRRTNIGDSHRHRKSSKDQSAMNTKEGSFNTTFSYSLLVGVAGSDPQAGRRR
ncbi:hypothetical protein NE237_016701 [Protea cynaroides]|uniref:Uncharacterized protein n=1 Tax=Protea cynaroides TaxID=273540 RepID=A0A9Q0HEC0_9MAGN|nr:hypothetical protein NE237_016701 [Protea cynaroides]